MVTLRGSGTPVTSATGWVDAALAVDGAVGTNPVTEAIWSTSTANESGYIEIGGYDFASAINATDTIAAISVSVRHRVSNVTRMPNIWARPYDGAAPTEGAKVLVASLTAHNDVVTFTPSVAQVRSPDFKIRVTAQKNGVAGDAANFRLDHVDVTVTQITAPTPLHLIEPFNDYTTNAWTTVGGASIVAGRTGTAAQVSGASSNYAYYTTPTDTRTDTMTTGVWWRYTDAQTTVHQIISFYGNGARHFHAGYAPSTHTLYASRDGTTLQSTTIATLAQNTWYYIECQSRMHDSIGTAIIRINGIEAINVTGQDTLTAGGAIALDQVRLTAGTSMVCQWDDLYVRNDATFTGFTHLTEPFDNFTTNGWVNISGATIVAGRTGTCAQQTAASQILFYAIATPLANDSMTAGFAVKVNSLAADRLIMATRTSAPSGTIQQNVFITTTGAIRVQNVATTSYTSATGLVAVDTWAYVEMAVKLHDSAGSITVRVNGTQVLSQTGIDTTSGVSATPAFDQLRLETSSPSYTIQWDDLYIRNDLVFQGDPVAPVAPPAPTVKAYNGTAFVDAPVKVYSGSAFVDALAVKVWSGSAWVDAGAGVTTYHIWHSADPVPAADATAYTLGMGIQIFTGRIVRFTGLRIFNGGGVSCTGRNGYLWSHSPVGTFISPTLQRTIDLPDTMTAGWTEHLFSTPYDVDATAGFHSLVIGYMVGPSALDYASADSTIGSDYVSSDGAVQIAGGSGRYVAGGGAYPTNNTNNFYGCDVIYEVLT